MDNQNAPCLPSKFDSVLNGKTFHAAYTRDLLSLQLRQESHDGIIAVA